jgi:hypothetical protein
MLARRIESCLGWPLRIATSPNERTLYNFPMQSGGAEMLRLAAWRLCEAGIIPCMLVHDGILFEETDRERIEHAKEIMRQAGRDVCDGFEIGVDVDQMLVGGARYRDKRPMAQKMWATIEATLQAIGCSRRGLVCLPVGLKPSAGSQVARPNFWPLASRCADIQFASKAAVNSRHC